MTKEKYSLVAFLKVQGGNPYQQAKGILTHAMVNKQASKAMQPKQKQSHK